MSYQIYFINQKKKITVEGGTIAAACEKAGFPLNLVCGGNGTCGKCAVNIKYNKKQETMATTSVNESGEPSLNNYDEIKEDYDDLVDLIVPPSGEKTSSLASTVVDITSSIKLLRQGAIRLEDIEKVITSE